MTDLRRHILKLNGLEPESTRDVEVRTYLTVDRAGFPVGEALSVERTTVTAAEAFDSDGFWSTFAAANVMRRRYPRDEYPYILVGYR